MGVMSIDLNADLGEECGGDEEIFPFLSSANVCAGAHAGGPDAIDVAVRTAADTGVSVGAHVGYEDRANFGRLPVRIGYDGLRASVTWQIEAVAQACERHGIRMRYVKPHGALYHRIGSDPEQARAVVDAIRVFDGDLHLLVPHSPVINEAAAAVGLQCRYEYFADRGYTAEGTLVDRRLPGALLTDHQQIVDRAVRWLATGVVPCIDGSDIPIVAQSICLHGDEPEAIESARALREALDAHGYAVRSWRDV